MAQRINPYEKGILKVMSGFNHYQSKSSIEKNLAELICFRVSQINGCAYCLDMHSKDLRAVGETEQRLYLVNTWKEVPFFTARERAALAWAEAVTELRDREVPNSVYEEALDEFGEQGLADLTVAV